MRVDRVGRARWLVGEMGAYSYYHPTRLFTGYVWDALTLGALFNAAPVESILILGLGGGTVARQCRNLFPKARLVGIELDRRVIAAARSEFALDATGVRVVPQSAGRYLARTRRRYDLIIDDTYPIDQQTPSREGEHAIATAVIRSRLKDGGVYAACIVDAASRRGAIATAAERLGRAFGQVVHVRPSRGTSSALVSGDSLRSARIVARSVRSLPPAARRAMAQLRLRTLVRVR